MLALLAALAAAAAAASASAQAAADPAAAGTVVQTVHGPIEGLAMATPEGGAYRRWQGVPFAAPPLGARRWRDPVPPSPWGPKPLKTQHMDIGCAQNAHSLDVPKNTSEDCLYLEVWAPPVGKYKEPANVLLFFYGGDFKEGGESFKIYNGRYLASTTNTILVVPNYRVGNLGFLYTGKTDANVGLMDQRFAMRWVQENIRAFGGNPGKVTILGQSAGGQSVLFHLTAPKSKTAGDFHGAIVESGPLSLVFKAPDAGMLLAEIFGLHLGCPDLEDLTCMQSKTTKEVLEAAHKSFVVPLDVGSAVQQWAPIIDGSNEFPQEPLFAFQRGELVPPVPLMMGSELNDGALFAYAIPNGKPLPAWEYVAIVAGIVHSDWIDTVLDMYPANETDSTPILSHLMTDVFFACPSRRALRWAQHAQSGAYDQTWLYQQTLVLPPQFCFWPKHQQYCCDMVCHGDELPLWMHDTGSPFPWNFTQTPDSLSKVMATYWSNFAATGDPNKGSATAPPNFPLYREESDMSQDFTWPLKSVKNLKEKECKLWDEVGYDRATRHQHPDKAAAQALHDARTNPHTAARVQAALTRIGLPTAKPDPTFTL